MYNINDLYILALNAYHEASCEKTDRAIKAIVWIVLNRCKIRKLSVYDVVYQSSQFSWTIKGKPNPLLHDPEGYKRIRLLVKQALIDYANGERLSGADHYYAEYIDEPYWVSVMTFIEQIETHKFYKSKRSKIENEYS